MKKILVIILLLSTHSVIGQNNANVSSSERVKILQSADEALDTYAPGYNRKYGTPNIEDMDAQKLAQSIYKNSIETYHRIMAGHNAYDNKDWTEEQYLERKNSIQWVGKVLQGRKFYIVTYLYDRSYEIFRNGYAAEVYMWADDYRVFRIGLGNGPVLTNLDEPETRSGERRIIRYQPRLMKDRPMPEIIIDENGNETIRAILD